VRTLIAERNLFKRVENIDHTRSFTKIKNQNLAMKRTRNQRQKKNVFGKYPLVMSIDKVDFNTTTNVEGEWFINEILDLVYFFAFASDFVPSDTSTDVDSNQWSAVDALTSLHAPIKSSFMVREKTNDALGTFFEVPAKRKCQKPILFEKIESEPVTYESLENNLESLQFSHYGPNTRRMMQNMGDLMKKSGLNFD